MITRKEIREGASIFTSELFNDLYKLTGKRFLVTESIIGIGFSMFCCTLTLSVDGERHQRFKGQSLDADEANILAYKELYKHLMMAFDFLSLAE